MAGIHGVDRNDVALLVFTFRVDQLTDQKLLSLQARVLASSDNSAGDAGEEHGRELLRALSDRQNVFEVRMRPRNDMDADELTDPAGSRSSGVSRRLHGRNVTANHCRNVAGPDLFPAHEIDLCGLYHRVGSLNHRYKAARFDHSEGFTEPDISTCHALLLICRP